MILKLVLFLTCFVTVAAQINLTPHGQVVQRTTHPGYSAHLAIEGPATNKRADGCYISASGQTYAWWGLQLPEVAHMTNILIYNLEEYPERMDQFSLYLVNGSADGSSDAGLCYTDLGVAGFPKVTQNITCNMLAKNMYFINKRSSANCYIELCYVAIYGCFKGTWGANCKEQCPPNCINNHCEIENGNCVWGCDANNCVNNKCDIRTGVCIDGCVDGRAGQYCRKYNLAYNGTATQNPPNPSFPASLSIDGKRKDGMCSRTTGRSSYIQVDTGSMSVVTTVYLTFADTQQNTTGDTVIYCSNTSNYSWIGGLVLYTGERPTKDINVFVVCRYITFVPPKINGVSTVDVCEIEIGGCPLGRYGLSCQQVCNCNGLCDLKTGNCTSRCLDGWVGYRCDIVCAGGYFGRACSRVCSPNCLNQQCNHVTGECIGGCNIGWESYNCTKECSKGYFGYSCKDFCKTCFNNSCDIVQGTCIAGCNDGFRGRKCSMSVFADSSSNDALSTQVGIFIGAFLLGAILAVGIMSIIIRRRLCMAQEQKNKTANPKINEKQYDNLEMETATTYQDLTSHSKPNDYDKINTLYINQ